MKLKIITTEKKITKSIVNQMQEADNLQMRLGTCLGYVLGIKKDSYLTAIIEHELDYFIMFLDWKKSSHKSVYRKLPKMFTRSKDFSSERKRDEWFNLFNLVKKDALKNHIYI